MVSYKNLKLIGTSHIAISSIKEVKMVIEEEKPDYVGLELDKDRLIGLMSNKKRKVKIKDIIQLGIGGFIFAVFGQWIEEKLGKMVGTKPGGEMKQAVISSAKVNAKLIMLDRDVRITIKRLIKGITFKEKMRFVWDLIKGLFGHGDVQKFDLSKVPADKIIEDMLIQVKARYPSVYRVLIDERNKIIAKKLYEIMIKFPEAKIVAVVGAGHSEGIIEEIKRYK
ncbi:MAG: TraB/GumN family protein [archaeon]